MLEEEDNLKVFGGAQVVILLTCVERDLNHFFTY